MDRYPNHQFAASSAQQYAWLESLYPKAFTRVSKYIKEGRFHYVGGAWLEHDCMMPSGESLVRQYLYGQRYFKQKFGSYCREAWLPDTFGYASQLPQILRLAGLNYFFTQKVSLWPIERWRGESGKTRDGAEASDSDDEVNKVEANNTDQLE
jgi:alpha-mannosidase